MLKQTLDIIKDKVSLIISGGAKGADTLAKKYSNDNNIELLEFIPDWDKYGKSAGYIRNVEIIDNCDCVVAFWDGESKGTQHSINIAKKKNKKIKVIKFDL